MKFKEETEVLRERLEEAEKQRKILRWGIVGFFLIVPLIVLIFSLLDYKLRTVEFYDDHVVVRDPFLSKDSSTIAFHGIFKASSKQTIMRRILNFGNVVIDLPGETRDIYTDYVINPQGLVGYLNTKIISRSSVHTVVTE